MVDASDEPLRMPAELTEESGPPRNLGQSGRARGLVWLALLVALSAAAVAGYGLYRNESLAEQLGALKQSTDASDQSARNASNQLGGIRQSLQAEAEKRSTELEQLTGQVTRLADQVRVDSSVSNRDWTLAEVEYLLRIANQRIIIEQETDSAIGLLQSADRLLRDTEGIAAFELRKVIANDVASLQSAPVIDVTGMYLNLESMLDQVRDLQQKSPLLAGPELSPDGIDETQEEQSGVWTHLVAAAQSIADRLQQLVVISSQSDPVKPILLPEEVYYLKQNLNLKLNQAQLALLDGHQAIFDRSIDSAVAWIDEHFETSNSLTVSMQKRLREMQGSQLSVALPDISVSLGRVRDLINLMRHADVEPLADAAAAAEPLADE